jgi:hypothetical protein
VNVYVVVPAVAVLTAGDQVPVIAGMFVELVGNTGAAAPRQTGATALNVGVINGFTVKVKVCGVPVQPLFVGVTVTVATTGAAPAFVAVKEAILPVPPAAKPIEVVLLVQL